MELGIVLQLQSEALDENTDIETLLRKAYLVAKKLNLTDFENWVLSEQNGYKGDTPEYRIISGVIKAWNPYHGWVPVIMQGKMADTLSKMPMNHPIASIVEIYKKNESSFTLSLGGELTEFLNENTDGFQTEFGFQSSSTEVRKIISAVRNKILEWSLLLEENGIEGNGLKFTETEKQAARESQVINNYTNNFYAPLDNTMIQQGGEEQCQN
ncbi:MAG: hypothetical protein IKF90_15335 [Parasporobacterium sp.]|nr:hypothetical protein [Parasporobacterium sp.]